MTDRHRTRYLIVAGVLAALSFGSPWGTRADPTYHSGWYSPGMCTTVYDYDGYASMDCTSGYVSAGYVTYDYERVPGYASDARVLIILAVGLIALAVRSQAVRAQAVGAGHRHALLRAGIVVAILAPVLAGLRASTGQLMWWAALVLVVAALAPYPRSTIHE